MNERILALDIGDVRIGVAVSDAMRMIATPVEVIKRVGFGPDVKRVKQLCEQYDTTIVLSGLPYNMDGTLGFQSEKVKLFCQQLEKAGLTVYYQDERLTTVTATNALIEGNMHRAERKHNVDKVAAAVILQQWLDTQRNLQQKQQEEPKMDENIIELIDDESGETVQFLHLATLMHEDKEYIAVTDAAEDDEECGVFFMEIIVEDGEDSYSPVEDEQLQDVLFQQFVALMDEEDDA